MSPRRSAWLTVYFADPTLGMCCGTFTRLYGCFFTTGRSSDFATDMTTILAILTKPESLRMKDIFPSVNHVYSANGSHRRPAEGITTRQLRQSQGLPNTLTPWHTQARCIVPALLKPDTAGAMGGTRAISTCYTQYLTRWNEAHEATAVSFASHGDT